MIKLEPVSFSIRIYSYFLILFFLLNCSIGNAQMAPAEYTSPVAPPPIIAPEEMEEMGIMLPPKTISIGFHSGVFGRTGIEMSFTLSPLFSFLPISLVPGFGGWTEVASWGTSYKSKQETNIGACIRVGGTVYGSIGVIYMTRQVKDMIYLPARPDEDPLSASGWSYSTGIPIFVGVETGKKRGNYLRFEIGYVTYMSQSNTRTVYDGQQFFGENILKNEITAPGPDGVFIGIAVGRYIK